jgi:hypothetical protein
VILRKPTAVQGAAPARAIVIGPGKWGELSTGQLSISSPRRATCSSLNGLAASADKDEAFLEKVVGAADWWQLDGKHPSGIGQPSSAIARPT